MSLKTENTNLQERVEWLEQQLASERAARERALAALESMREAHAAEAAMLRDRAEQAERREEGLNAHLNGVASFIGPCVHGRDPRTRCEECSKGNAVTAVLALLRQAEREREEARRVHAANVEAGAALAAEFDKAKVGNPADGVFTRARVLLADHERAEADNAGLVGEVVRASAELRHAYCCKQDWNLVARAIEILERAPNPGGGRSAALLERLRALEKTLGDAAEWMRKDAGAKTGREPCRHAGSCKWQRAEAVLLAAEALRGKA